MIPKIIHYCWFGDARRSRLIERCMRTWPTVMPAYTIKEWSESNSPMDHPYVRAACAERRWSKISNYVRLHALLTEGGIYLDTDVEVRRDFAPLLAQQCFVGFQQHQPEPDWVNNAVIGAVPGHAFVQRCLDLTLQAWEERGEFARSPTITTTALRELGLEHYGLQTLGAVTVYPIEHFYPHGWFEQYSADRVTSETYCVHHWAMSWVDSPWRARLWREGRHPSARLAVASWLEDLLDRWR